MKFELGNRLYEKNCITIDGRLDEPEWQTATEFTDFLDYIKSLEERIWIGTFRDVAAYTAVAKDVKITVENNGKQITVTPSTGLDKDLYATALTLEVASAGKKIKADQDGQPLDVTVRNGKSYVTFCPFGGTVTIR